MKLKNLSEIILRQVIIASRKHLISYMILGLIVTYCHEFSSSLVADKSEDIVGR